VESTGPILRVQVKYALSVSQRQLQHEHQCEGWVRGGGPQGPEIRLVSGGLAAAGSVPGSSRRSDRHSSVCSDEAAERLFTAEAQRDREKQKKRQKRLGIFSVSLE